MIRNKAQTLPPIFPGKWVKGSKDNSMQLTGIHHLTAISAKPRENLAFYTGLLGMRLVKKTVNQDDVSAYHLFYADGKANPGTDLTFFDFPAAPERRGTNSISRTGLRVAGEKSLGYWSDRLKQAGAHCGNVSEVDGRLTLPFEDGEGQRLVLIDDGGAGAASPWQRSAVPAQHQIRGLGPIVLNVHDLARTEQVLTGVMNMRRVRDYAAPDAAGCLNIVIRDLMINDSDHTTARPNNWTIDLSNATDCWLINVELTGQISAATTDYFGFLLGLKPGSAYSGVKWENHVRSCKTTCAKIFMNGSDGSIIDCQIHAQALAGGDQGGVPIRLQDHALLHDQAAIGADRRPGPLGVLRRHVVWKGAGAAVAGQLQHPRPQGGQEPVVGRDGGIGDVEFVEVGRRGFQRVLELARQ